MSHSEWTEAGHHAQSVIDNERKNVTTYQRGMFNMTCFNGIDGGLQKRLVYHGNLPMGWVPSGRCHNPAEVEVTTIWDEMPGPRFYCIDCAIEYLTHVKERVDAGC